MGMADRRGLRRLKPSEKPVISRRAMTKPWAVMALGVINTGCLAALFMIPEGDRALGFTYVIAYAGAAMLFYLINYNLGVRRVELFDAKSGTYSVPGPFFQAAGLAYDSAYEMALLISPTFWVPFYLGILR